MKEPILEMRGITKKFGSVTANKDVDLTLYPGEIHALLGENGAGKSTLMNILNGIYKPNHGKIYYKGKKVSIRSPRHAVDMGIGMVHQHFRLIPTLTAAENVFLYMPDCKLILNKKEMEEQIGKWSSEFHLNVDPSALIWQLSVGEQQRVEIVKLLCRGAEILILDEPSAVLTAQEAKEMFHVLRRMADSGKSVVVISHKMNEVMEFADRITVLKGGEVEDTMPASEATGERLTQAVVGERELKPHKNEGGTCREEVVLKLENLSVKNDRDLMAIKNVSLDIHAGEILGIAGVAGNGQKELADTFGALNEFADYNTAFTELQAGALDALAIDVGVAKYQLNSRGEGFKILDETLNTEQYAIGFKKGNDELCDIVNADLQKLADDGTVEKLAEKYEIADMVTLKASDDAAAEDTEEAAAEDKTEDSAQEDAE